MAATLRLNKSMNSKGIHMKKLVLSAMIALLGVSLVSAEVDSKANRRLDNIENGNTPLPAAAIGSSAVTAAKIATSAVTSSKILDGTILVSDLNRTNAGIVSSSVQSRGLRIEFGACTGTAIKVFTTAFGGVPAVFIGPEADIGTGRVFAASVTTNGFTASGFGQTIAAGWMAIGLSP